MSGSLYRANQPDLEVRSDGRTVHGVAVPWDTPARVNDGFGPYTEVFRKGAFERTIRERGHKVKALANHDRRSLPLGRANLVREDAAGLYTEVRVSKTRAGDEALELVRDGALDAFSVGFIPVREREGPDGLVERTEVRLNEVSLVAFPAYDGAAIAGIRGDDLPVDDARSILEALEPASEGDRLILRRSELYVELRRMIETSGEQPFTGERMEEFRAKADDLTALQQRIDRIDLDLTTVPSDEVDSEGTDSEAAERASEEPVTPAPSGEDTDSSGEAAERTSDGADTPEPGFTQRPRKSLDDIRAVRAQVNSTVERIIEKEAS